MTLFSGTTADPLASPQIARGKIPGFSQGFWASYRDQRANNSSFGLEAEFAELDSRNNDLVYELTGERLNSLPFSGYYSLAEDLSGEGSQEGNVLQNAQRELNQKHEKRISELKKQYPQIKSRAELFEELKARSRDIERNAEEVGDRSGFSGTTGAFVGGVAGSFSFRDPFNIATLGAGGFGKTLLVRLLTEAGANASVEFVNQLSGVHQNRKLLGLETGAGRIATNVALAGAGAAGIRGGVEGGARGAKYVAQSGKRLVEMTRRELLSEFQKKFPKAGTTERAIRNEVERELEFIDRSNPFAKTREGSAQHITRLSEAEQFLTKEEIELSRRFNEIPDLSESEVFEQINKIDRHLEPLLEEASKIKNRLEEIEAVDPNKPAELKKVLGYTPETLTEFIRRTGGIVDESGELASRGVTNRNRPGLIRTEESGKDLSPDYVRERVFEQGFFEGKQAASDISDNELFDAIADDLFDRRVFKGSERAEIENIASQYDEVDQYDQVGITKDMSEEQIARALFDQRNRIGLDDLPEANQHELLDSLAREQANYSAEAYGDLSDNLELDIDNQWSDVKENLGEFAAEGEIDLDEEIPVDVRLGQDGELEINTVSLRELMIETEADEELNQALRVCGR